MVFPFLPFHQNSVNACELKIPYPWLVFNEKVKVNSVFLRDSTGVSDSVLLLFGGNISRGGLVSSLFILLTTCIIFEMGGDIYVKFISSSSSVLANLISCLS